MNAMAGAKWQTSDYEAPDQLDAWREALSSVYGLWNLTTSGVEQFHAEVISHSAGQLQIVNCVCDPCGAIRKRTQPSREDRDILAIQVVVSGREHFTIDDNRKILGPGDVLIWNTTRPMAFEVTARLHKYSLLMPLARLRHWLPHSWYSIENTAPSGSPAARLLSSFVNSMLPENGSGILGDSDALTEAAIGIIVGALGSEKISTDPASLRDVQFLRVKRFINTHLDDPELSPTLIANANRISVRYLHWLFVPAGISVLQYVIRERLLRCRRELLNPVMAKRTITEIAYSWGFQNSTHFSRRFKGEFGVSPHELRSESDLASQQETLTSAIDSTVDP
jgi:AraC-like DNA-binding protein